MPKSVFFDCFPTSVRALFLRGATKSYPKLRSTKAPDTHQLAKMNRAHDPDTERGCLNTRELISFRKPGHGILNEIRTLSCVDQYLRGLILLTAES